MEVNKKKIVEITGKHLKRLVRSLGATKNHFLKTQIRELKNQMAYTLKADEIFEELESQVDKDISVETYIATMNLRHAHENCEESAFLNKMIPGNIIVSTVSTIDYYIFEVLHTLLDYDKNLANSIDIKQLQYKDIQGLRRIQDVREYCLSTYLESLFFGSHDELFETISKKFNLDSIKKIARYKDFVFVTELRNIIVHHDSKISLKFKLNMEKYKIDYTKYNFFDEKGYISLDSDNVLWIIETCLAIAIQIYLEICEHYLDRNSKLNEIYTTTLNGICVDLISSGYSTVCYCIYDILLGRKQYEKNYHLFSINKALCLKKMNKRDEMVKFLDTIDWRKAPQDFMLARSILLEDYEVAIEYMDKVDLLNWDCGYQDWPLCTSFVKTELFKEKYASVYGHEYEKKVTRGKLTEEEVLKIIEEYQKKKKVTTKG